MTEQMDLKANPEIVRKITAHLVAAYEEYINSSDIKIGHLDGFMAAHNFHCAVLFHLELLAGFDAQDIRLFRKMALDTFAERLDREKVP